VQGCQFCAPKSATAPSAKTLCTTKRQTQIKSINMSTRQVYIDSEIHQAVDIVFNKTFVFSSAELKNYINTGTIQIDYNKTDNKKFLPFYDKLF